VLSNENWKNIFEWLFKRNSNAISRDDPAVVLEMNLNKSPDPIDSFLSAPPMNKIKIGKTDLSASRPWHRLFLA
jgi:hypothetical protein